MQPFVNILLLLPDSNTRVCKTGRPTSFSVLVFHWTTEDRCPAVQMGDPPCPHASKYLTYPRPAYAASQDGLAASESMMSFMITSSPCHDPAIACMRFLPPRVSTFRPVGVGGHYERTT